MEIKVKTSLRIILISVVIIPLIILALTTSFEVFGFSSAMIADESICAGDGFSAGVNNLLLGYMDEAKTLASLPSVEKAVPDLNSVKSEIDGIRGSLTENRGGVLDIVIVGSSGNIVSDGKGSGASDTFYAYDKEIWESKQTAFVTGISANNAKYGANVFSAVSKLASGSGYVACVVDTSALGNYLSKCTYGKSGFFCVTDQTSILNFNSAAVSDIASCALSDSAKNQLKAPAEDTTLSLDDPAYVGAFGKITGTDWVWVTLYAKSDSNSLVTTIFIISIAVAAVLAVVSVLVMIAVTHSVINPMLKMVDTMKVINSGDREERIDTSAMKSEFARISETFNAMMDEAIMSEELHKTVSDLSDNMLFEYDFSKESMFVSNNFNEKIGLNVSGSTLNNGRFIDSLMDQDGAEQYKRDMNTLLKNKDDIGGEYEIKDAKGQPLWVAMRAHCITDRLGEILRVIGVLTDINSEKNATLKLAERASYDFLSQLYNRNTFEREFQTELERNANKKIAILFLDVDDFKFINDRYNHAVGDEVIRYVADTIKARAGESGFAGRFGGDEFVLCVSDPKMIENVEVLSMDIIDDLYSGYYSASVDTTLNIKASIGIAVYPVHSKDSRTLIACADTAMYFVKKNGKANYHIYDPSDEETTMGAHTL